MGGLCCATGLLLADLSWNDIKQVPQGLPATLVSLNLGHNRLADLPATLSALALLPKLRILHLKVSIAVAFPAANKHIYSCTRRHHPHKQLFIRRASLQYASRQNNVALLCRGTHSACSPPTCQLCSKHCHCSSTLMAARHPQVPQLQPLQTMPPAIQAALQLVTPYCQKTALTSACMSASPSCLYRTRHQGACLHLMLLQSRHHQRICTTCSCILLKAAWCAAFPQF